MDGKTLEAAVCWQEGVGACSSCCLARVESLGEEATESKLRAKGTNRVLRYASYGEQWGTQRCIV